MDFIDQLKQFSTRIEKMTESIQTEEATKTSMIMPFFQMLGYDVFNPLEFVPEYTADVGIKKGEKVDYAIMDENQQPLILIEAKWCGESLDKHASQLFRYFSTTPAKFGILTNGIVYRFYTDLEEQNKMDDRPFLEINLLDIKESLVPEIKKFQKTTFDLDTIMTTASELKYNNQIKQLLAKQLIAPDDEFITYIAANVYEGRKTQKIIGDFRDIVKKSFSQFINEQINDRLKSALGSDDVPKIQEADGGTATDEQASGEVTTGSKIVTTQEELEGFFIIKTLVHDCLGEHTISYKDTETYFGIMIDNNTRKWFCRLLFGEKKMSIIIPDETKNPVKHHIDSLDDIYALKDELCSAVNRYIDA